MENLANRRGKGAVLDHVLSPAVIPVALEYYHGTRQGWVLAVAFALIGLVDAILSNLLAIAGLDLFLIPASAWIVADIALLAILYRPTRWSDQT
jgi:predicted small integral membrane protein